MLKTMCRFLSLIRRIWQAYSPLLLKRQKDLWSDNLLASLHFAPRNLRNCASVRFSFKPCVIFVPAPGDLGPDLFANSDVLQLLYAWYDEYCCLLRVPCSQAKSASYPVVVPVRTSLSRSEFVLGPSAAWREGWRGGVEEPAPPGNIACFLRAAGECPCASWSLLSSPPKCFMYDMISDVYMHDPPVHTDVTAAVANNPLCVCQEPTVSGFVRSDFHEFP